MYARRHQLSACTYTKAAAADASTNYIWPAFVHVLHENAAAETALLGQQPLACESPSSSNKQAASRQQLPLMLKAAESAAAMYVCMDTRTSNTARCVIATRAEAGWWTAHMCVHTQQAAKLNAQTNTPQKHLFGQEL